MLDLRSSARVAKMMPRHDSLCWSVSLHTLYLGRSAAANVVEGTVPFVRDVFQRLVLLPTQSTLDDDAFVFLLDRLVDCEARFHQLAVDALQRRDHEEQMLRQGVSLDDRSPVAHLCEMFSQRPGVLDLIVDPGGCLCEEADGISCVRYMVPFRRRPHIEGMVSSLPARCIKS